MDSQFRVYSDYLGPIGEIKLLEDLRTWFPKATSMFEQRRLVDLCRRFRVTPYELREVVDELEELR